MNRKLELLLSRKVFPALRCFIYKHGLRPKSGSVFFSPSLNLIYSITDHRKKHLK